MWIQGRDVWNAWVEENPNADISFQNVDFNQHRNLETININHWPFAYFNFPTGKKNFCKVNFGIGEVSFENAVFGDGYVSFDRATFGDGDVSFYNATFGEGGVWFYRAKFGPGAFTLDAASLGIGSYNFGDATFLGRASFANLINVKTVTSLSFRHASFEKVFALDSGDTFGCVPDLVGTKTSHHTSLAGLKCVFPTMLNSSGYRQAKDKGDAERLRRLKELAEQNRDFEKTLDFRVEEMRAARWRNKHGFATALVEGLFWLASDYGRSLVRPLCGLIGLWLLGAAVYAKASTLPFTYHQLIKAMPFSWGQMFVYIPSSKEARTQGLMALFGEHMPNWLYFITFSQSLLTLVLLFQVGLVLRNRFKL